MEVFNFRLPSNDGIRPNTSQYICLAADPEVPGSIPRSSRFSEKWLVLERGSLSLVRIIEKPLERKSSGSGLDN
jgi:hypothetical protein